jgi:hypothetical protein
VVRFIGMAMGDGVAMTTIHKTALATISLLKEGTQ